VSRKEADIARLLDIAEAALKEISHSPLLPCFLDTPTSFLDTLLPLLDTLVCFLTTLSCFLGTLNFFLGTLASFLGTLLCFSEKLFCFLSSKRSIAAKRGRSNLKLSKDFRLKARARFWS
jgi:hypothetical protein